MVKGEALVGFFHDPDGAFAAGAWAFGPSSFLVQREGFYRWVAVRTRTRPGSTVTIAPASNSPP